MSNAQQDRAEHQIRLDRIEKKIDQMAEAIIALARAEEKIITLVEINKQQGIQILGLIQRVDKLDQIVRENAATVSVINKLFWIVIAAAATTITGMLFIK
jgi:ribosome-binding ATPase YchF (GTP1/OBG family)|tara:strand:+ start:4857 stop:5156 length:300 start_codon:yes stop_codon:yes gene_type:complete